MSEGDQDTLLDALISTPAGAPLRASGFTARERAILAYTDKLTLVPAAVVEADVRPLRDAGLDDRAIHDVCAIVAYFAFVNRIADGLGVELEPEREGAKDRPSGQEDEAGGRSRPDATERGSVAR